MIRLLWYFLTLVMVLFQSLNAQAPSGRIIRLQKQIDKLISPYYLENAVWGITVQSLKYDDFLYVRNSNMGLVPASNMKLFTSVFALSRLGPDFEYTTRVYLQGRFVNDTIFDGNVIIRGMGDPTISGRYKENVTEILEIWADSLVAQNIKVLKGKVIGDDNYFGDDILGKNWEWDSESYWYSAQISGLSFNDNCLDYFVIPTQVGRLARIRIVPHTSYVKINNRIKTIDSSFTEVKLNFVRRRASNTIDASGHIPFHSDPGSGYVSIDNPTLYTATVFKEILQTKGVAVEQQPFDIDSLKGFSYDTKLDTNIRLVATYTSPQLSEILKVINKNSQNFFAEQVLRTVSAESGGPGTGEHAIEMELEFLDSVGIKTKYITIVDGSGYARTNQVSPMNIIAILRYIRTHKHWRVFYDSLPIAGVDGTLKRRMRNTPAHGNVRAKTGFVDKVRTISGFLRTFDNEPLVFSIMCNNFTVNRLDIEKIQDKILAKLASFSRK